jgi:hypothetical protein
MKNRGVFLRTIVIAAALSIVSGACAAKNAQNAMNTERMLHAAGFQVKIADTPEKLVMLKGLAQRKIVPYPKEGEMYYLYADAASCQCLYMGTADAYQRYIEFKVGQSIGEDNRKAAQANANAAAPVNMGVWGGWGPWY